MRAGIRAHRDSTGHALCWHHPALWNLLPERTDPLPTVPTWPESRIVQRRQAPARARYQGARSTTTPSVRIEIGVRLRVPVREGLEARDDLGFLPIAQAQAPD